MSNPTMAEMSGERPKSPTLKLNEIGINGQTGKFIFRNVLGGLKPHPEDNQKQIYETRELGTEIDVVFLKVRRKLTQFRRGEKNLQTNEHSHKKDWVTLYGLDTGVLQGTAEDLRAQYDKLRTVQIVYALYEGELVRVFVKGSSLGSENKADGTMDFYSYISSFKRDERDDHMYDFVTTLKAVKETGDLGPYYCMTYVEKGKVDDETAKLAEEKMVVAYNYSKEVDEYFDKDKKREVTPTSQLPTIDMDEEESDDYPEEDINPDDIPF